MIDKSSIRFTPEDIFYMDVSNGCRYSHEVFCETKPYINYYIRLSDSDYSYEEIRKIDDNMGYSIGMTKQLYNALIIELEKRLFKQDFIGHLKDEG